MFEILIPLAIILVSTWVITYFCVSTGHRSAYDYLISVNTDPAKIEYYREARSRVWIDNLTLIPGITGQSE